MNITPVVRWLGTVVAVLSLSVVFQSLWQQQEAIMAWRPAPLAWLILVLVVLGYVACSFLLSSTWGYLLKMMGCALQPADYHAIYGRSQIAKYLPGNVFHFAGRQILGLRLGCSHVSLAKASLLELVGLLVAAGSLAGIGLLRYEPLSALYAPASLEYALLVLLVAIIVCVLFFAARRTQFSAYEISVRVTRVVTLYLLYFIVVGWLFSLLVEGAGGTEQMVGRLITGFALIWIVGYLVPGAPGGIGIRELLITWLLLPGVGEEMALVIAVLFRVATLMGDAIYFLLALLVTSPENSAAH